MNVIRNQISPAKVPLRNCKLLATCQVLSTSSLVILRLVRDSHSAQTDWHLADGVSFEGPLLGRAPPSQRPQQQQSAEELSSSASTDDTAYQGFRTAAAS